VESFSTHDLASACRIYFDLAYPDTRQIPESKRAYHEISAERPLEDFLPPAACANGVCQDLSKQAGGLVGYEFRLGSVTHPHMKLRIQLVELHQHPLWVYSVNTHDRFHQATQFLSQEEAAAWEKLVEHNRALKHTIEEALAQAGFITPIRLLRIDLTAPANPT